MNKNTNTKRKTSGDVRLFKKFISELNGIAYENEDDLSLTDFTPAALDNFLARFFMVLTKADGGEYEPDTLTSIDGSVFRHLRDQGYPANIKTSDQFVHSRDVLASRRKLLKSQGLGNKKARAQPLTPEEIDLLYQKNQLGTG